MARRFLVPIDLGNNQILNAEFQMLASDPGSPPDGLFWLNTTTGLAKVRIGGVTIVLAGRLDQLTAPTAPLDMNNQKITTLADGTSPQDAVNKRQLDAAAAGLDPKASVRVASIANVNLASPGATIDGVSLVTGDRVLLKNQTAGAENGIYVWNGAASAMTRAPDADVSAEVTSGLFAFVEEGTANGDTGWVLTTNNPISLGVTVLVFSKFSAAAQGVGKFSTSVGDGVTTSFNVDHNMGTLDVLVNVYQISDGAQVEPDITRTSPTRVVVAFATAPTTNQYRVVVVG